MNQKLKTIIIIRPGTENNESKDWEHILSLIYSNWANRHNYHSKIINLRNHPTKPQKTTIIIINNVDTHYNLRSEIGVHRLIRISPFDPKKRRWTSFAIVNTYKTAHKNENQILSSIISLDQQLTQKEKYEQARSYTLHPYQLVKDHRTNVESNDTQAIFNGNIDMFIKA